MSNDVQVTRWPLENGRAFRVAVRAATWWQLPGFVIFAAGLAFSISFSNYAIFALVLLGFITNLELTRRPAFYRTPLDFAFLGLYATMVISSVGAYFVGGAAFGNRSLLWTITYTAPVIYYTLCYALPGKPRWVWPAMAAAFFVAAAANSAAAIFQFFRGWREGADLYTLRPSGRMFYMTYGGVMALVITAAAAFLIKGGLALKWRLALGALTAVMLGGLAASLVRSAWLGLAASFFVIAVVANRKLLWAFPIAVAVALAVAPRPIIERATSIFDAAAGRPNDHGPPEGREAIWHTSLEIARDYPFTGVGLHNVIDVYEWYREPTTIPKQVPHAHNNYIQLVVERGVVGFAAFAYFVYALFALFIRGYRRARAPGARAAALAGIGGMAGFLVGGFFEYTFGDYEIMAVMYALAAIVTVALQTEGPERTAP